MSLFVSQDFPPRSQKTEQPHVESAAGAAHGAKAWEWERLQKGVPRPSEVSEVPQGHTPDALRGYLKTEARQN